MGCDVDQTSSPDGYPLVDNHVRKALIRHALPDARDVRVEKLAEQEEPPPPGDALERVIDEESLREMGGLAAWSRT